MWAMVAFDRMHRWGIVREAAFSETDLRQGNVGAGTGATVGKYGPSAHDESRVGHCALQVGSLLVGAVVAVNAMGDVLDEHTGRPLAGFSRKMESACAAQTS